jgi:hypothetical protein
MKRIAMLMLLGVAVVLLGRMAPISLHGQQAMACEDDGGERGGGDDDPNG